jgi:hypothetical protein
VPGLDGNATSENKLLVCQPPPRCCLFLSIFLWYSPRLSHGKSCRSQTCSPVPCSMQLFVWRTAVCTLGESTRMANSVMVAVRPRSVVLFKCLFHRDFRSRRCASLSHELCSRWCRGPMFKNSFITRAGSQHAVNYVARGPPDGENRSQLTTTQCAF